MPAHTHNANGPSQRQLRLGELLRHALSEILVRGEIRDDDLRGAFVTVSEVRVSPDARAATAFVMPLGGREQDTVVAALNRNAKYLRGELARSVTLKYTPTLRFLVDHSFDEAERIEQALRSPEVARDLEHKED